ncbi:hypothetical protein LI328DRAFT_139259 [Trichoderma asperelloides]|nr:hypothetical protein LI328DRAFT_139259 [Trichoderma asperelloides]
MIVPRSLKKLKNFSSPSRHFLLNHPGMLHGSCYGEPLQSSVQSSPPTSVIFLNIVWTLLVGFINVPQYLDAAITRTRQAGVITMHIRISYQQARDVGI